MMSQQSQSTGPLSPANQTVKRKRGRPRKDDSQVQGDNNPILSVPDSSKKNKQNAAACDPADGSMVGQMVTGVIEGTFDAGYLLHVRVGDTDTHLRGLVFLPGRFIPITASNDVAPNVSMHPRREIAVPVENPQTQLSDFAPPSEHINDQAAEVKTNEPKLPVQVPPSEPQLGAPITGKKQSASVVLPLGDNLPRNETGFAFGETVLLPKVSYSEQESQAAAFMAQLKHDRTVQQEEVQQGTNMEIEANKESEPAPAPLVDITPSAEIINQEPEVENQALSSDLKPNELVQNEVKDLNNEDNKTALTAESEPVLPEPIGISMLSGKLNLEDSQTPLVAEPEPLPSEPIGTSLLMEKPNPEDNQTPLVAEPEFMPSEPIGIRMLTNKPNLEHSQTRLFVDPESMPSEPVGISMLMEKSNLEPKFMSVEPIGMHFDMDKQNSPKKDTQETPSEPENKTVVGEDASYSVGEAANVTAGGSYSVPMTNLPVTLFEGEAIPCRPAGGSYSVPSPKKDTQDTPSEPENKIVVGEDTSFSVGEAANVTAGGLYSNLPAMLFEGEAVPSQPAGGSYCVPSPKKDTQETPSEPENKIVVGEDTSYSLGEAANVTAGGSYSVPMTNLPVMLFEGEALPSQRANLGTEDSVLTKMIDTQICSSAGATNTGDSSIKDTITATHLELSSGVNLSGSGR